MEITDNRDLTHLITDVKTGVVQEIRKGDRYKIISQNFLQHFDAKRLKQKNLLREWSEFAKVQQSAMGILAQKALGASEWAVLWVLCEHLRYNDGKVRYGNGRRLSAAYVAEKTGRSRKTVFRAMKTLQDGGFLLYTALKTGLDVRVNPFFVQKGPFIEASLMAAFASTDFYRAFAREGRGEGKNDT